MSLLQEINEVTGIPTSALQGAALSQFSIDERLSWAARRQTKCEEDAAYFVMGLYNIHMPLIYGEGRRKAFARLGKEIELSADDGPQNDLLLNFVRDHWPQQVRKCRIYFETFLGSRVLLARSRGFGLIFQNYDQY